MEPQYRVMAVEPRQIVAWDLPPVPAGCVPVRIIFRGPGNEVLAALLYLTMRDANLLEQGIETGPPTELLSEIHGAKLTHRTQKMERWYGEMMLRPSDDPETYSDDMTPMACFRWRNGVWERRHLKGVPEEVPIDQKKQTYFVEDETEAVQVAWLLDDAMQAGAVGFLPGMSGSGKTFLLVHMALCGALKRPFFGRTIPQAFGTYVLAAEGAHSIPQRVRTAAIHSFGRAPAEAQRLPIAFSKDVPNLLTKAGLETFIAELNSVKVAMGDRYDVPLRLVQIDTFGQTFIVDDENAAAQIGRATKAMQAIAQATGATVIATHHFGHSAKRMRGSSALRANADFVIEARDNHELFLEKCRDGAEVRLGWYELPIVTMGAKPDGSPVTSRYVRELSAPRREADPGAGFTAMVGDVDPAFEAAFEAEAKETANGRGAPERPVRVRFLASLDKPNRMAWKRAKDKAIGQGYTFTGDTISKPAEQASQA
jgi:RecA-family ATPase